MIIRKDPPWLEIISTVIKEEINPYDIYIKSGGPFGL